MTRILLLLALGGGIVFADATPPEPAADPPVACRTVDDCWLGPGGVVMKRPKRLRGKPFPRGDCGVNHHWLRNRLACEENVCVTHVVGDRC